MAVTTNVNRWAGWGVFSGLLLAIQGAAQIVMGISEISQQKLFFVSSVPLTHSTFIAWGWVAIAVGVLLLAAGYSALHYSPWSRVVGACFVALAFVANLVYLPVFPLWGTLAAILSGYTLYALLVRHADAQV